MYRKTLPAIAFLICMGCATRKPYAVMGTNTDSPRSARFFNSLVQQYPQYFDSLFRQNDKWHIRIIYTRIDRDAQNRPHFKDFFFNTADTPYFYPASTVKMPAAFLALQKLHGLNIPGLDRNTTMITEAAWSGQTPIYNDPTSGDGRPTIAQYIKRIFLVSDNDAFNRLYEFLGQEYINQELHKMGYDSVQVLHRLDISLTEEENRHTNPVKFYDSSSAIIYQQPLVRSNLIYQPRKTFLGNGYYTNSKLVDKPFDFSAKNRFPLQDLHSILRSVIFPDAVPKRQRFNLTQDDYSFLYRYMSMMPRESDFPQYDSSYSDAYVKFLLFGGKGAINTPGLRIFNKTGDAYGFLTDVAYIVDLNNKVEFMLSATIACNSDGIFNDDHYDYEEVGLPFMKNLGQAIYQYELQRRKKHQPDLTKFNMSYGR